MRILIGLIMAATIGCAAQAADLAKLRRGYVDSPYGQLHYVTAGPAGAAKTVPIVLLHQSPNSSAEFEALVPVLGRDRVVLALDTPGYGGSDGPSQVPKLEDYAAAIAASLKKLGYGPGKPVDVFGYHTGSKIATELAITEPRMVRKVMLSGIYAPPDNQVAKALANLHHPTSAYDLLERLGDNLPRYKTYYEKMGLTDAQWGKIRIDSLRGITRQEFGHEAAFRYTPRFKARLAEIKQPVLLLPMDDGLAADTRAAASLIANGRVTPVTYSGGGFFTQPDEIAGALNAFSMEAR
jgi:pimeloyl-ACP methyl ester carboxylesterase